MAHQNLSPTDPDFVDPDKIVEDIVQRIEEIGNRPLFMCHICEEAIMPEHQLAHIPCCGTIIHLQCLTQWVNHPDRM